jgi:type IV pilus assembly protein PilV
VQLKPTACRLVPNRLESTRSSRLQRRRSRGFSLVEVMVALIVCSVGLLGLAKMESLALSSTGIAGERALAALQASSLGSMMHANRDYWGNVLATAAPITVNATNNFSTAGDCTTAGVAPCTPQLMAQYDLKTWAQSLNGLLPGYQATITCQTTATAAVVTCSIQIQWIENGIAMDTAQQANISSLQLPTYTVYVEP